jgi:actin-related protein 5
MRLNVGGHHATELLHKILALQSPANRGAMSYEMIEQVKHQHCFIAPHDYISTLREYQELSKAYTAAELDAAAQSNEDAMEQDSPVDEAIHILQLPFVVKEVRVETEEDRQRKEQRRLENAQRMRDLGAKKKQAQIIIRRARLDKLDGILIARKEGTAKQTPREEAPAPPKPASNGDDDDDEVIEDPAVAAAEEDARFNAMSDDEIRREMQEIRRYLHRAEGTAPPPQEQQPFIILTPEEEEAEYRVKFPLLYVADSELSPEQIKEKIKQRAMKNFAVGARRRQMEKLQNPDEPESAPAAAASQPSSAPSTPANNSKLTLVDKVLAREGSLEPSELLNSLHQLRKQLTDRIDVLRRRMANTQVGRQSRIAAKRMKLLAQAADEQTDDSDFGANDDDWDVYLQMQSDKDALAALATETGEEGIQDPTAQLAKDEAEVARIDAELAKRTDPAEYARKTRLEYQLCLGLERIRSPEVIMQPQMVGIDQMGLPEAIMTVINRFEVATRAKLLRRIYVTGGNAMWPTLQGRLTAELQPDVSVDLLAQSGLRVKVSPQSVWAPWRGAALFGLHHTSTSAFVSRQVYDEEGVERIIARRYHMASNPGWQYL